MIAKDGLILTAGVALIQIKFRKQKWEWFDCLTCLLIQLLLQDFYFLSSSKINMIKISKSILILLISFIFLGSANADRLTWSTLLFPKLEKFNDCVTNLINQDIDNEHQLCTEKYGKENP